MADPIPCAHCGAANAPGSRFCEVCGTPLPAAATPAPSAPPGSEATPLPIPAAPAPAGSPPPRPRRVVPLAAVLVGGGCLGLLVLALGALAAGLALGIGRPAPTATAIPTATPTATATPSGPPLARTYTSSRGGYRLQYPDGWELSEQSSGDTINVYAPGSNRLVGVGVTYFPDVKEPNARQFYEQTLLKQLQGGVVRSVTPGTLAGQPSYTVEVEAPQGSQRVRLHADVVVRNGHGWLVGYYAPADDFDRQAPTLQAILRSFQFTG